MTAAQHIGPPRRVVSLALGVLAAGATVFSGPAACVSDDPSRTDRRPSRDDVTVDVIYLLNDTPEDLDGNGYPDTFPMTVYLWNLNETKPVRTPGEFRFNLLDEDGEQLAEWVVPSDIAPGAVRAMPPGPAFLFRVNVLQTEPFTDRFEHQPMSMSVTYTSTRAGRVLTRVEPLPQQP